jgi:hypothetical protein
LAIARNVQNGSEVERYRGAVMSVRSYLPFALVVPILVLVLFVALPSLEPSRSVVRAPSDAGGSAAGRGRLVGRSEVVDEPESGSVPPLSDRTTAPTGTVIGVVDDRGHPVPGARVQIRRPSFSMFGGGSVVEAEVARGAVWSRPEVPDALRLHPLR